MLPSPPRSRRGPRFLLVGLIAAVLALLPACAHATAGPAATTVPGSGSGLTVVTLGSLPPQAADTYRLVRAGGPFPNRQDGIVFGNREKLLPAEPSGYYHEYTVATPGSSDRGARRLVTGSSGEYFYTGDHYRTFVVVDVTR